MASQSVSVVVPLYNHARYISSAIYSVVQQTCPAIEIIIVDDGSADASPEIARAIADIRQDVIFWRHPNRGAHNTINAGLHRATGDVVAILNSDDMFHSTRFEKALAAFDADPSLDLIATRPSFIDGGGRAIPNPWFEGVYDYARRCGDIGMALVNGNFIMTTSNFLVRRRLFHDIGYFGDLRYAHDLDFLLRMVNRGKHIGILDEPLLSYRLHETNTISEGAKKVKLEWAAVVAMYLSHLWTGTGPTDWNKALPYLEILRKNALCELVLLFMSYFHKTGMQTLERADYRNDSDFLQLIQTVSA